MTTCGAWGGKPGRNDGLICTEPRGHKGDHDGSGFGQWPNNLDRMTRLESAKLMATYVGANAGDIVRAEDAGRLEARTKGEWKRQSLEALDFVYMEARDEELLKSGATA